MSKRIWFLVLTGIFLLFLFVWHLVSGPTAEGLFTGDIRKALAHENSLLQNPPALLGISSGNELRTSCAKDASFYYQTRYSCSHWRYTPYPSRGVNAEELATYQKNAPKLLELLRANGWSYDNETEYKNSVDKIANVAWHKNIGSASCNLEITVSNNFNGGEYGKAQLSSEISVNFYSCSAKEYMPDINFQQKEYVSAL